MGWAERAESFLNKHIRAIAVIIAVCGFAIRIYYASKYYLNTDEALHYTVATQPWHGLVGLYHNATRFLLHPPLLIVLLQPILWFGHSEVLLRLVPAICGALFPWFVMLWVQKIAGNAAALCAQLLLTFSPTLIDLGAEIRAYTLAFLLFSIYLLFLEKSLDSGSKLFMIWSTVFLYLAILSEYSVAWFVAAAGIYAALRLLKQRASGRLVLVWALGQIAALGLYFFLYKTQIAWFSHEDLEENYTTWLQLGFPEPHQNTFRFALHGTMEQFRYMFQIRVLTWAAAIAFLFGLYWLWRRKSPAYAILIVLPFCFACVGAIFHLFPYGSSRHTAILDIAIAATVGAAIAQLVRGRLLPIVATAPPCVLIWVLLYAHAHGFQDPNAIPRPRHHVQDMREAAAFLQNSVPSDALLLTDTGTGLTLGYYCGCSGFSSFNSTPYRIHQCGKLRIVMDPSFQFGGLAILREALVQVHEKYGSDRQVWIAAGGFDGGAGEANSASEARPFGKAIAIFQESDLPPQSQAHP